MRYQPELIERPAQPTLTIRTITNVQALPKELGNAYADIIQYLRELGEQPAGAPFAGYFNMDMQNLEVEIGFPVTRPLPPREKIQPSQIPPGKYGSVVHVGPYNECAHAYDALTEFVSVGGHQASGMAYEMYLNDPTDTPENELQTLILFPLN
jgi:effector-binding domain-containing protein